MALGKDIPVKILLKLVPIIAKQTDQVSKLAESTLSKCISLPDDIQCNDPRVETLKRELQNIQTSIQNIQNTLNSINQIIPTLQTIINIASILKIAQLAIPNPAPAPSGPITQLIITFTAIIDNSKAIVKSLQGIVNSTQSQFNRVSSLVATIVNTLGSICNTETFTVSSEVAAKINRNSDAALAAAYPSDFYTTINVSQEDIDYRFNLIRDLLDQQVSVMNNLFEAPTKIYTDTTPPASTLGEINDYFINVATNKLYGPKTVNGWGNPINL
jgi:hypothetical protein